MHLLFGNRAAAQLKVQRPWAALRDAEAALAIEPAWPKALYRKALALQGLGQQAAAAAAAQQALELEPGNRDVQALLRQLQAAAAAETAPPLPSPSAPHKPAPTAALLPPLLGAAPWEYAAPADGVHENLLLLLHGLGDRPTAFARLAAQMALPQVRHACFCLPACFHSRCCERPLARLTQRCMLPAARRTLQDTACLPSLPLQTAALALGGPQAVPFTEGRSWYTVFDDEFKLIEVK